MKVPESGMPEEALWEGFFDVEFILSKLELSQAAQDIVEFGCGYGTFSVAAAKLVAGTVHALDIERLMLQVAQQRCAAEHVENVEFTLRDFIADGTGLAAASMDYAMLFNILHTQHPVALLQEARRNLRPDGKVGVIHWNYDPLTPRGPPMDIRPTPEDCRVWALSAGFTCGPTIDLPPYHYGLVFVPAN